MWFSYLTVKLIDDNKLTTYRKWVLLPFVSRIDIIWYVTVAEHWENIHENKLFKVHDNYRF